MHVRKRAASVLRRRVLVAEAVLDLPDDSVQVEAAGPGQEGQQEAAGHHPDAAEKVAEHMQKDGPHVVVLVAVVAAAEYRPGGLVGRRGRTSAATGCLHERDRIWSTHSERK